MEKQQFDEASQVVTQALSAKPSLGDEHNYAEKCKLVDVDLRRYRARCYVQTKEAGI